MFEVFRQTTPLVEGLSIDEAFLDVGGLRRVSGTPVEIAMRLRREVRERVGLPITVGVARTKFLAKVASGVAKPDGLLVVPPDGELAFLHPLPVERLWGVGPVTAAKLRGHGVTRVGQVARLGEATLVTMVGQASGRHLHALAHNRDPRPVDTGRRRRSIGSQRALGRSPRSPADLDVILISLVDRITRRMRTAGRAGRTVVLRLRFDDFTRATRSHTLSWPTSHTPTILATARTLLAAASPMIQRQGITLLGLAVANLDDSGVVQLTLPFDRQSQSALDSRPRRRPRPLRLRGHHPRRPPRPRPGPLGPAPARLSAPHRSSLPDGRRRAELHRRHRPRAPAAVRPAPRPDP